MSDWAVHLVTAGSLPMRDGLMAPRGEFGDIDVVSNVLVLQGSGGTVLVDTAAGGLDDLWEGARSNLAEALAPHCRVEDVDAVVLTHLDFDHFGGAADIPAERIFMTKTAADWARTWDDEPGPLYEVFKRLDGRLTEVADGIEVLPGVRLVEAPGHREGHACVEIDARDGRRVFLSDVIHHPTHVQHPEWDCEFDSDVDAALRTRRDWLERLAGTGTPCAASHIVGWGTIEPGGDGLGWRPL
ncbi:MAG TPA: MBL fold metallo-hydrolase [Gaiellales bacterium]|jgi:glyoxylase-like metal-dependent hydrolase (beta-lactamase superfamily II)|nr:MBL fold metallo-hydrolase [Gaiellales bacterium]